MDKHQKIKTLDELANIISAFHADGKKIAHCHGVFDLMHIGHIRHFEQAKKLADILVVTVTQDMYVNKGPHRPAFPEDLRAESIAALDCVDFVAVNNWPTSVETIKLLKPDIYVKGSEYKDAHQDFTGKIVEEAAAVKSVGGEIAFTEDITFSSSGLINKFLPAFPKDVSDYLITLAGKYSTEDILKYLENAHSLKTLVIGESIIDEYQYCESIGKSTKEPALVAQYRSTEKYAGGILAVSNHVASFCDSVGLLTFLGTDDSQESFIREHVRNNVKKLFLYKENAPTIIKRRFIESYLLTKLFEIYVMNGDYLQPTENRTLCETLERTVADYDVVIVVDYGHGMMSSEAIDILCKKARFLAVNTQTNAGNRGFNTIYKYPKADFVTIAENEIRLEFRNQQGDLKDMAGRISEKMGGSRVIVTRGKFGCLCYNKDEGFFEVPAFVQQVVDRIGAGDALLSITALCAVQQAPMEIVGFIGNVVGAEAVMVIGNKTSVERAALCKHIVSLLK